MTYMFAVPRDRLIHRRLIEKAETDGEKLLRLKKLRGQESAGPAFIIFVIGCLDTGVISFCLSLVFVIYISFFYL